MILIELSNEIEFDSNWFAAISVQFVIDTNAEKLCNAMRNAL